MWKWQKRSKKNEASVEIFTQIAVFLCSVLIAHRPYDLIIFCAWNWWGTLQYVLYLGATLEFFYFSKLFQFSVYTSSQHYESKYCTSYFHCSCLLLCQPACSIRPKVVQTSSYIVKILTIRYVNHTVHYTYLTLDCWIHLITHFKTFIWVTYTFPK